MGSVNKGVMGYGPRQRARSLGWACEEDFAATIVAWLRDTHWEVYQEVEPRRNDGVADIVAVRAPLVWIVETKLSPTWELLHQATMWAHWAHYVSVAVPSLGGTKGHRAVFEWYCRDRGIGILKTGSYDGKEHWVDEEVAPRLERKAVYADLVVAALTERHKDYARAGNAKGLRYTPFQATCEEVRKAVERKPGLTLKECIDGLEHHFHSTATARSAIAHWAKRGVVKGVRAERDGRFLRLYPENGEVRR